jgi:hypothetical protein
MPETKGGPPCTFLTVREVCQLLKVPKNRGYDLAAFWDEEETRLFWPKRSDPRDTTQRRCPASGSTTSGIATPPTCFAQE